MCNRSAIHTMTVELHYTALKIVASNLYCKITLVCLDSSLSVCDICQIEFRCTRALDIFAFDIQICCFPLLLQTYICSYLWPYSTTWNDSALEKSWCVCIFLHEQSTYIFSPLSQRWCKHLVCNIAKPHQRDSIYQTKYTHTNTDNMYIKASIVIKQDFEWGHWTCCCHSSQYGTRT